MYAFAETEELASPTVHPEFADLCGSAPAFQAALDMAQRAAATNCSVLIVGETGTGKELFARAIHRASERKQQPFVPVNCGAISRELIASELFGHERGSFTGATRDHDGVFVRAHDGTLFLDELGELPLEQQAHLLRVLETRSVRRLGGQSEREVDVRVVAATNRLTNLGTDSSSLRLDLFHRVATVILHLPPLRERLEDIPLLVHRFMAEFTPQMGERDISPATMRALARYSWPGNVRELRQAVLRAMAIGGEELTMEHLLPATSTRAAQAMGGGIGAVGGSYTSDGPTNTKKERKPLLVFVQSPKSGMRPIDLIIRDAMIEALETCKSLRGAARSLGLAKSTFCDWAKRLGIVIR
jgi:transcriptional regulator with PAS, ATPase and Fis domain